MTTLSSTLFNIAGESLSVGLLLASGLPEKVENQFNNPVMTTLTTGFGIALADDLFNYFSGVAPSALIGNMHYKAFINTGLWNSAAFASAHFTGVDAMLGGAVSSVSPLPQNINAPLVLGTMIVGANVVRQVLADQPNPLAQYIVQPLSIVGIH
jgi:hypothetical protein